MCGHDGSSGGLLSSCRPENHRRDALTEYENNPISSSYYNNKLNDKQLLSKEIGQWW